MSSAQEVTPLVSVSLATFNRAHLVAASIDSVLAQTYTAIEIIVVDDGSTDDTAEVIQRDYADDVTYVHQENQGVAGARNTSLQHVSGEYVAIHDDDDVWLSGKLDRQVTALEANPQMGFAYCAAYDATPDGECTGQIYGDSGKGLTGDNFRAFIERGQITHPSLVIRRECLDAIGGYDESLRVAVDTDMILRLTARYPGIYCREPLLMVRQHADRKSVDDWETGKTLKANDQVFSKLLRELPEQREDLRPLIQRKLGETRLLAVELSDVAPRDTLCELLTVHRNLPPLGFHALFAHLSGRILATQAEPDVQSERVAQVVSEIGDIWAEAGVMDATSVRARIEAAMGVARTDNRRGVPRGRHLRRALRIAPMAALRQVAWAVPGAARGVLRRLFRERP